MNRSTEGTCGLEFQNDDWLKGKLPHWATAWSDGNPMQVGAHLATRDGRVTGNAVVYDLEGTDYGYLLALCVTDVGNIIRLTRRELIDGYYTPEYIHTAESIMEKLQLK